MNQIEFIKLEEKYGEPVKFCQWCQQWKPFSRMYKSYTSTDGLGTFLGTKICNSCYYKFRKIVTDPDTVNRLFEWLEKNLKIKIKITQNNEKIVSQITFKSHQEGVA